MQLQYYHGNYSITMTSPVIDAFTTRPATTASPPTQAPLASAPIIGGVVGAIAVIMVGVVLIVLIVVCAKGGSKAGHQR